MCRAFGEHCKTQREFPKAKCILGRVVNFCRFNIMKIQYQPPPANLWLMSAVDTRFPFVSDYPVHVMLPALCFTSPTEGPSECHRQPLPNPA